MYNIKNSHRSGTGKAAPIAGIATFIAMAAAVSFVGLASGCSQNSDSAKDASIKQALQTQQTVIARSGGDWNKLSASDQQALINGPGYGSKQDAQNYLQASYARSTAKIQAGPEVNAPKPPGN